ncbi:hypothetical protein N7486_004694 [Penicillium sp. IBT 16267x]|nr:hypothetical protein N7486_004694 [Penicillium sp. IBT 16267x]
MPVAKGVRPAKKATPRGAKPQLDKDVQFLYAMITAQASFKPDWKAVSEELGISQNAASKRWNRIQKRFEDSTKKNDNEEEDEEEMLEDAQDKH